jgi:heme-degrading monooxygenase HmoA
MAYVRVSIMTPIVGQDAEVQRLLDELVKLYQGRPGFITAYRLSPDPHAGTTRMGRISVWETEDAAHRTAAEELDIAFQSQLKGLVHDATHEEYSFIGVQPGG